MGDTLLTIIIAALAGGLSGAVASLLAPWANWGVETRRQRLTAMREIVDQGRAAIAEVVEQYHEAETEGIRIVPALEIGHKASFLDVLEKDQRFTALKPHLHRDTVDLLGKARAAPFAHSPEGLKQLYRDIGRLEKQWKLI